MADENKQIPDNDGDIEVTDAEVEEQYKDPEKIIILPGGSEDGTAVSFQIKEENHTLGNALRYIIMKNPDVEFCGYSIPHPSEARMNIRIQTHGEITAIQALNKGLKDLVELCDHVETVFRDRVASSDYSTVEPE